MTQIAHWNEAIEMKDAARVQIAKERAMQPPFVVVQATETHPTGIPALAEAETDIVNETPLWR